MKEDTVAKLKEITVSISRKLSDDNYGSFGVQAAITLEVEEGEDKNELYAASASWLSAKVAGTHKQHGTMSSQPAPPKPQTALPAQASVAQHAQQSIPKATTAADDEDIFDAETITVEYTPGGEKRAKVKGGRWKKYGVMCWPETLKLPPLEWDLDELDAADYPVPGGVQAVVLMVDDKPKKVIGWK